MSTRGLAEFANSISSGTENPHSGGSCLPWLCARHHLQLLLFGQKAEGYDRFAELLSFPTPGRLPEFAGLLLWQNSVAKGGILRRVSQRMLPCLSAMCVFSLTILCLCRFSVPLLILLANSAKPRVDIPRHDESPYDDGVAERSEP